MIEIGRLTNQRYSTVFIICGALVLGMVLRKPLDNLYPFSTKESPPIALEQTSNNNDLVSNLEQLFFEGDRLLKAKEFPKAMGHFKALLTSHPNIVESMIKLSTDPFHEEL